jgi:glucose/arabinose dehydrogenase
MRKESEDAANDTDTVDRIISERREFLAGIAATTGGLVAGCTGGSGGETPTDTSGAETDAPTPTESPTETDAPTPTESPTVTETPPPEPVDRPRPGPAAYEASPAVPPEEALETFETVPGGEVELVAAEPLIHSPVDIEWDARGRMWVVEMPDYMGLHPEDGKDGGTTPQNYGDWGGAETPKEEMDGFGDPDADTEPTGRIVVLEDPDDDGVMEEATVFADGLTLPRSIAFVGDGVLVGLPGELVYYEYDEETLEHTLEQTVQEGYASEGGPMDNPEHTDNGLMRGLDNWLYNAKSDIRLRFEDGKITEEETHSRGQWGIDKDDYGRLYYTTNSTWLLTDLIPGQYLLRGGSNGYSGITERIGDAGDPSVYSIRENYGTNRAFRDGYHREDGRMKTVTGVAAPGIYRDDLLPFRGSAFVSAPASNTVGQFDVSETPGELDIDISHNLYDDEEWETREFLASTDEVFRPITTATGPDGALYVVDMYRGVFQHVRFLTDYLAEYMLENNLHKVPPAGRIYRVVPQGHDVGTPPNLAERSPEELAAALEHSNGWVRDTAQRLFVENDLTEGTEAIREIARTSGRPLPRIHALWTLHGMDAIDTESVVAATETGHARVQQAAIRTGEALLGTEDAPSYVETVIDLGTAAEQDQRVVVQAAYSLGEVSSPNLAGDAEDALGTIREMYGDDDYVADAIDSAPDMDA